MNDYLEFRKNFLSHANVDDNVMARYSKQLADINKHISTIQQKQKSLPTLRQQISVIEREVETLPAWRKQANDIQQKINDLRMRKTATSRQERDAYTFRTSRLR